MSELATTYGGVLAAWVVLGGLSLVQALVADVAAMRTKHTPGMPVTTGHDDFFFRAVRAQANTLENLPVFIVLCLAAVLLGASPSTARTLAWIFVGGRVVHMLAYYADQRTLRSTAFAASFLALIGLFVVAAATLV